MNYLKFRNKLPSIAFKLISNNRRFSSYTNANFDVEFDQDFDECLKVRSLNLDSIKMETPQALIDNAKARIVPFQYENRQNIEKVRYVYLHNFLYELFNPEILERKISLDGQFPINLTFLPNYLKSLIDEVKIGLPDHALVNTHTKRPILIVEDKSGEIILNRAALQCSFYSAAYASRNELPHYYGVGSTLEKFIFLKYTKKTHKIELSREYKIFDADIEIKFNINELNLVANILRYVALKINI